MSNRLFCTFTSKDNLEYTLDIIKDRYDILFNKIYILKSPDLNELMCTYNINPIRENVKEINNTILLHRKKATNTLYTINALNLLIQKLNNGILDTSYIIEWSDYPNCILLIQDKELKIIGTTVHNIVNVS